WKLVLLDDFAGSSLDTKIWTAVNTDEVYNNELECYRASNAYTEDGNLVLEAAKRKNEAGTKDYTSAKLITKGKKSWTNGKFEIRAKLPGGQGIWPAIWMLPEDDNILGGWPSGGEIDIMEFLGHETNKVYGTLHYGNPHSSTQGSYKLPGTDKFTDGYHVYGMEWEPGEIRWYVDGQLYFTENSWYSGNTSEAD
ncbi:glycoside hydrolase family 16 protein, partial [Ruminiclostridium cellobioparum]|uniref:glycoside hydrolase family 16 protein n=1 Tax=Ruminiclostridium cellobioparum TaxID=29355 RepID=UPI0028AA1288